MSLKGFFIFDNFYQILLSRMQNLYSNKFYHLVCFVFKDKIKAIGHARHVTNPVAGYRFFLHI